MLFLALSLLSRDPALFVRVAPLLLLSLLTALLIAVTVHEFSHAFLAFRLGDTTAQRMGRLSLNPLAHLDPVGTVLFATVGFGWGKPVPVNPLSVQYGRHGLALVSLAGPLANVVTAGVFAIPIKMGLLSWYSLLAPVSSPAAFGMGQPQVIIGYLFVWIIYLNLILAVFNLLPIFPLDGSKIALGLLPSVIAKKFARLEVYGPVVLLLVIGIDMLTDAGILFGLIRPMVNGLGMLLLGFQIL